MNQILFLTIGAALTAVSSVFTGLVFFILRQISHKIDGLDTKIDEFGRAAAGEQVRVEYLTDQTDLAHRRISDLRRDLDEQIRRLAAGFEKQLEEIKERIK